MYNANRTDVYFGGELDKFIKIAKNHARKEKTIDFQGRGGGGSPPLEIHLRGQGNVSVLANCYF